MIKIVVRKRCVYIMKKKKIKLDKYEIGVVINSLNEMRNKLLKENKDTEVVDELLLKYINILEK